MKTLFYLSATLLLLFQPKNIQSKPNGVEINVLENPLGNELRVMEIIGDEYNLPEGRTTISPNLVIYDAHWQHKTVFLLPDNSSSISLGKDKQGFWLVKKGENVNLNACNFDVSFRKNVDPIKSMYWGNKFNKSEYISRPDIRDKEIADYYNVKKKYLIEYREKFELDDDFSDKWNSQIYYEEIVAKTDLGNFYNRFPKKYLLSLLNSIHLNKEKNLILPSYRSALWNILYLKYFLRYEDQQIFLKPIFEVINSEFSGSDKDFLQFFVLKISLDDKRNIKFSKDVYRECFEKFISCSKNKKYKEYLKENNIIDSYPTEKKQLVDLERKLVNFSDIYDNKSIVYVDYWASWCAPCRSEIPASKKLYERYKNKGINFLYISIDDNSAAWAYAVKQLNLPKDINYLILNTKKSHLLRKYNINSIPRYIILKDGKIIYSDAPRPSDNRIHSIFDSLLKI